MSKKSEQITFRTTPENLDYLKLLCDSDDRTMGYILNRMIESSRAKGVKKASKL